MRSEEALQLSGEGGDAVAAGRVLSLLLPSILPATRRTRYGSADGGAHALEQLARVDALGYGDERVRRLAEGQQRAQQCRLAGAAWAVQHEYRWRRGGGLGRARALVLVLAEDGPGGKEEEGGVAW